MDYKVYSIDEISDDKISELVASHDSFKLTNVNHINDAVVTLEKIIERKGLSCRIYTKGRSAAVGAAAIPISPTVIGGWLAAAAIGVHNLATYDPDYEIAKNKLSDIIEVNYKK